MTGNAHARYQREKTKVVPVRLFLSTDRDILDRLDQQDNRSGYIKRLIREDVQKDTTQPNTTDDQPPRRVSCTPGGIFLSSRIAPGRRNAHGIQTH